MNIQTELVPPPSRVKVVRTESTWEFHAITGRAARAEIEIISVERVAGQNGMWEVTFIEKEK